MVLQGRRTSRALAVTVRAVTASFEGQLACSRRATITCRAKSISVTNRIMVEDLV
jgi:hypothetical protein